MMNLDAAKVVANDILAGTNIKAAYYVDDKFEEDPQIDDRFEPLKLAICSLIETGQVGDDLPERVRFSGAESLDAEMRKWWVELSTTEKQQLVERYVDGGIENTRPATLIRDVLEDKCICCSPAEWKANHEAEVLNKIGNNEPILLLFDHELSNGRNGFQYAEETLSASANIDCVYCGIISQSFTIDGEFSKREEYKTQQPTYYIYPLSKRRLDFSDENYESFILGLKNVLWVKHIESIKKQTQDVFEKAFNNTIKRYSEIQPPAYKKIIFESSIDEGCREIDTTLRLMQIILDKEVKQAISEGEALDVINYESNCIYEIHNTGVNSTYPEVDKQATDFIKDERFLEGSVINRLHTPLQNGDIFLEGKNLFILLCQPCNISIRKTGDRSNIYDVGFFVPLKLTNSVTAKSPRVQAIWDDVKSLIPVDNQQANSQKLNGHKKEFLKLLASRNQTNYPLGFEIDGKEYTVQLNNFKTISLSLLDNVSFCKDGKAVIDFGSVSMQGGLHRNLVARQRHIKEQLTGWIKIKQNTDELCDDCQWLIDLRELFLKSSPGFKFENIESDKIILPIQRIGHYRKPYSDDLLTQFSHYISRAGFPHSFV